MIKQYPVYMYTHRAGEYPYKETYSFTVEKDDDDNFLLNECASHDLQLIQLIPVSESGLNRKFVGLFSYTGIGWGHVAERLG